MYAGFLLFICRFEDFSVLFPNNFSVFFIDFALEDNRFLFTSLHTEQSFCEFVREFYATLIVPLVFIDQDYSILKVNEALPINLRLQVVLTFCLSILQVYSPQSSFTGFLKMSRQRPVMSLLIS